eukprot:1195976-Prorocentrum_minimum.AAC.3
MEDRGVEGFSDVGKGDHREIVSNAAGGRRGRVRRTRRRVVEEVVVVWAGVGRGGCTSAASAGRSWVSAGPSPGASASRQRVEHLQASKSKSQSQSQSQWTQQQPHLGGRERLRHPGSLSTVSQCHSGAASVQSKRHSVTVSQRTSSVRWLTSASIARGSATQPARCSLSTCHSGPPPSDGLPPPAPLEAPSPSPRGAASVQSQCHSVTVSQRTSSVRWLTSASAARGSATQPARCSARTSAAASACSPPPPPSAAKASAATLCVPATAPPPGRLQRPMMSASSTRSSAAHGRD